MFRKRTPGGDVMSDGVDAEPEVEDLAAPDARAFDASGFDALFDRNYDRAVRLAFLTGAGNETTAGEIAADALARVWLKWRARKVDDFWPYLRVAVINEVRSAARHNRVAERHEKLQTPPVSPPADDWMIVERDAVAGALRRLPVRQRTVLVLRYFEDLTYEECAKVMRCSVGTAKSTAARALVALRAVLEGQGNDVRD
jgi:RNA polymerase sigma factor (sigma-70 family)